METVSSVLKDMGEVGTIFGGELKVFVSYLLSLGRIETIFSYLFPV